MDLGKIISGEVPLPTPAQLLDMLGQLPETERKHFIREVGKATGNRLWMPLPGPQTQALLSPADIIGFGGAAGGGKLSPLDELVLTPKGWREIGSLKVGDTVTDPTTGGSTRVIGVFPQGERDIYRVTCDDGATCEVGLEHLWAFKPNGHFHRRPRTKPSGQRALALNLLGGEPVPVTRWATLRVGNTGELIRLLEQGQEPRIPLTEPVIFTVNGRTGTGALDPYFLGVYLGDGTHTGVITNCDGEVQDYLLSIGCSAHGDIQANGRAKSYGIVGSLKRSLTNWLHDNGLNGKRAWEKFVPPYVLTAPVAYRLAFLQGLMDTDGYVDERGRCYFTSTSADLAKGVQDIVRGLGGKASLREKNTTYTLNGEKRDGRTAYEVRVQLRRTSALFRMSRKIARCTDKWNGGAEMMRAIVSIEKVRRAEAVCIAVDSPMQLYVTRDYIVTHNTDLLCGLVLEYHTRSIIFRREKAQTEGIVQRLEELLGNQDGLNSQKGIWKMDGGRLLEFGGLANPDDRKRYQGRPHDLKAYDEATEIPEEDVRWTMGWARTNNPDQRVRRVMTFNPPDTAEGRWIIRFFAPWIDKKHPNRAVPGELRWFATIDDDPDREVPDGRQFVLVKGEPVYDFDPRDYMEEEIVTPMSRTFIPSRVTNNPFYMASGYVSQLQAMPEPYRSRLLYGDFEAGMEDAAMQVIPTAWVEAAMERWKPAAEMPVNVGAMDSMGVDVARGGRDNTVIARRHGTWFDDLIVIKGTETTDGAATAGAVMRYRRNMAPVHVDVVGWGASVVDHLRENQVQVIAINGSAKPTGISADGNLKFMNLRAEQWWRMREALDPKNPNPIALPDDAHLLADLTAPLWRLGTSGIQVESKDDLRKRIGRSPDRADAVIYALVSTMKAGALQAMIAAGKGDYDPFEKDWR